MPFPLPRSIRQLSQGSGHGYLFSVIAFIIDNFSTFFLQNQVIFSIFKLCSLFFCCPSGFFVIK